jgi:UDP-glucose 4-epimerase
MKRIWVIGAGGMLGKALTRSLYDGTSELYRYRDPFDWTNLSNLTKQFEDAIKEFLKELKKDDSWQIYWVSGLGSMGSSRSDLETETASLENFLKFFKSAVILCDVKGVFTFSSSAGALYAGNSDFEITENSSLAIINDYGFAKFTQEKILQNFVFDQNVASVLVARLSTLYGPGQAYGKRQGLLSHIARCALRNQPVEIFVPLDTSRDYLFIDDAANKLISTVRDLESRDKLFMIKIMAAEHSVTISEIIATFNRLNKKPLRIIHNRNKLSSLYAPRLAYRSESVLNLNHYFNQHTLLEGVAKLLRHERMLYCEGFKKD